MTSVANQVEIGHASPDPSFETGSQQRGPVGSAEAADEEGAGRGSDESRVLMELDLPELKKAAEGTVSEVGAMDLSLPPTDSPEIVDSPMGESFVPELRVSDTGGVGFAVADPDEGRDFEDDTLSDEVVASDGVRVPKGAIGNWMNGFEPGDMVWGKVKSHPWWPGHIFNEAFASPSVRRSRSEGYVLVAFFGDSSYGWFDPAELIPFDPHYDEKSKQTNLRPFAKAVEEAADETSRREALALTCYCRSKSNFRPARVPGYFHVDVPGFEPGGIYSSKQISSAREKFVPEESLYFVKHAAMNPLMDDAGGVELIKSIAILLAYRRAVFEEFDETYAQAFGVQPVRPSPRAGAMTDQPERFAPRGAPLSGPLVVAESLRLKKSSASATAPKIAPKAAKPASAKKNKYVLKRRDDQETAIASVGAGLGLPNKPSLPEFPTQPYRNFYNLFPTQQQQQQQQHHAAAYAPHIQPTLIFQDASFPTASTLPVGSKFGDYVLQKRTPAPAPAAVVVDDKQPPPLLPPPSSQGNQDSRSALHVDGPAPVIVDVPVVSHRQLSEIEFRRLDPTVAGVGDAKDGAVLVRPVEGPKTEAASKVLGGGGGIPKEKKIKKRMREDGSSVGPDGGAVEVRKKKKKKEQRSSEVGLPPEHVKVLKIDDPRRKSAFKSIGAGHDSTKKGDGAARSAEPFGFAAIQLPQIDLASRNLQLPELVSDLQELALDPFYGVDRDVPLVALHAFLKFRSLVFQKSLAFPLAGEAEASEVQAVKSPHGRPPHETFAGSVDFSPATKADKEPSSASRLLKAGLRSDDPTVVGRKRTPSDRQEEMSAKRQKKLDKLKSLAGEKKAAMSLKGPEGQQQQLLREQKESGSAAAAAAGAASAPAAPPKQSVKKQEAPPPRVPSPTTLVMKFPPRTTLPSVASLKARFARFGPLELSGTRVYWKSNTCKVVYKFKPDAESALNYAKSNEMFGQVKVHFYLRDADAPATEATPEASGQRPPESRLAEGVQFRPGNGASGGGGSSTVSFGQARPLSNPTQKPAGQLKSILKKPGEDGGPTAGREAPRVKFMLDGTNGGKPDPPAPTTTTTVSGGNNGRGVADAPPSSLPLLEPVISKTPKSVAFLPPPPPQPSSRPPQSYPPSRVLDHPYLPLPPPVASISPASLPPPPQLHRLADRAIPPPASLRGFEGIEARGPARPVDPLPSHHHRQQQQLLHGEPEGRGNASKDFASQMLSLLVRCSDIVSSVKSSRGYVPYHPL